ncbi:MAG: FAD-dependent oxidoreductase [Anaerolineales bacterium]|nr:FAD-dependent oxidoreductase [Anaerolineales bacterium]
MPKGEGKYNVVVIGAGSAGLVAAAATAGLGGRVALIERNRMGGDCLNFGCVPSKALIASARAIAAIRNAGAYGLRETDARFDFGEVFDRMRRRRAQIEPHDSQQRFESLGVDVFRGEARFLSPGEVRAGEARLRAKNFVIAAGSRASLPDVPGLPDVPYYTNETIFDRLNEKPGSILVIGGGPVGCELAQVFQRLGVQTTILENGPRLLLKEDPDVSIFVQERLKSEGVRIVTGATLKSVSRDSGRILVTMQPNGGGSADAALSGEALLVAAGRTPNVEGLNLEAAGVRYNRSVIEVNQYLQTSRPHIFAVGDIAGPYRFTHVADFQARTAVRNILLPFWKARMDYSVVPWSTYVDPEVARVGLNETEAKRSGMEYVLFSAAMDELDRAVVSEEAGGFIKVLAAKGSDRILGVTLVAAHAGDLIHEFVLAMKHGIGLGKISATIHAYPTMAEIARKIGDRYQRTRLTPAAQKLFAWLYRLGRR